MSKGRTYKPEHRTFRDEITGATVHQLTDHLCHSNHLYFTHLPYYAGGTKMLFHSDRGNSRNLFELDLTTFEIRQLTDFGPDGLGVRPFGACVSAVRDEAFFWVGRNLRVIDLVTLAERDLWEMPEGVRCLTPNCSSDGRYVFFATNPIITEGLPVDRLHGVPFSKDYWAQHPHCRIMRLSVEGGEPEVVWEEDHWLGHVNTSPHKPNLLTFCHEGPWTLVKQRMWGLDAETGRAWKIRPEADGDVIGHEYWFADGSRVGYHGRSKDKPALWGHADPMGGDFVDYTLPRGSTHFQSLDASLVVSDGSVLDPHLFLWRWNGQCYEGAILMQHRCSFHVQYLHCHPAFVPPSVRFRLGAGGTGAQQSMGYVLFTADIGPYGNIFVVEVPEFDSLPKVPQNA
ncbi:MAG: oligogalacturonate lyase family protein [Armatimonadota bacterium]